MKSRLFLCGSLALCLVLAAPAEAAGNDWHIRAFAAGFDPSLDEVQRNDDGDDIHVTGATDLGFGVGLEYQISDRWGIEVGYLQGEPEIELSADVIGYGTILAAAPMQTRSITVEVDFHLTPKSPTIDFYLGAGIAIMSFGNVHYDLGELGDTLDLRILDDSPLTLKAGIDISFGKNSHWAATGGLRYTDAELTVNNLEDEPTEFADFDFGLLNFTIGIAYSF